METIIKLRLVGSGYLLAILAGLLSITPAVDSPDFLHQIPAQRGQVQAAIFFQLLISFAYVAVAVLLYPFFTKVGSTLSIGFLLLKISAAILSLIGTAVLFSIFRISIMAHATSTSAYDSLDYFGQTLKDTRDFINHFLMVLVLCTANILLYVLTWRSRLVPRWLSCWGIWASILSMVASCLVFFDGLEIISTAYILLNSATALHEIVFAVQLIRQGR